MSRRHKPRRPGPSLREASSLVGEKNLSSHKVTTLFLWMLLRRPEGVCMTEPGGSSRWSDPWVSGGHEWTTRRGGGVRAWLAYWSFWGARSFHRGSHWRGMGGSHLSFGSIPPRQGQVWNQGVGGREAKWQAVRLPRGLRHKVRQA